MPHSTTQRKFRAILCCICLACGASAAVAGVAGSAGAAPRGHAGCDPQALGSIPARPADAPTGSQFAQQVKALSGTDRDAQVRAELLAGNIPAFLRRLVPVMIHSANPALPVELTVCVLPDYLAVGSNSDFVFVPMGLEAALEVARRFGFELPTRPLVDAIYQAAAVKLTPMPLPATDAMRSTAYFVFHNELINRQRSALDAPLGELTSGHKKDLVLTSRLWTIPGRVAIYGWHRDTGQPIQPLSTVHGARYADYSHGVRFVSDTVYVDGRARSLAEVLAEPMLAKLLTDEGPWQHLPEQLGALMKSLTAERANP